MALESFQISELKKPKIELGLFFVRGNNKVLMVPHLHDPCSLKDRTPMHFADIDWENIALASNGNCGILLYKNLHLSFASQEPDISYVVHEEIVSTEKAEEPMPLICQAEMVAQVYPTVQEQCEQLVRELSWSTEQSNIIAKKSVGQSSNSTWALYRVGIITASRMLSVLRKTDERWQSKRPAVNC